jgi:hypothetical protein
VTVGNPKLIVVDHGLPYELNAIQVLVAAKAESWWHQMTNVWIIDSLESAVWWRDTLAELIRATPGRQPVPSLLVLDLPPLDTRRSWAYFGPRSKAAQGGWLNEYYAPPMSK